MKQKGGRVFFPPFLPPPLFSLLNNDIRHTMGGNKQTNKKNLLFFTRNGIIFSPSSFGQHAAERNTHKRKR